MQRNGGGSRLDMDTLPPPSADGGRSLTTLIIGTPMFSARWKRKLAPPLIVSADDGHRVFFPFGPLRGYALPKRAFESIIGTSQVWLTFTSIGLFLAIPVVSKLLNLSVDPLLCIALLCFFIGNYIRTKRIARYLVPLPRAIGMRVYARALGPLEMWKRIWFFVFAAAMSGTFAFPGRPSVNCFLLSAGTVFFIVGACVFGRAQYLGSVNDSIGPRNILPANKAMQRNGGS